MDRETLLDLSGRFGLADPERVDQWRLRLEEEAPLIAMLARAEVAEDHLPVDVSVAVGEEPPGTSIDQTATAAVSAVPRDEHGSVRARVEGALSALEDQAHLNAFTAVLADEALQAADELDRRRKRGEDTGPLTGWVVAVKDLIDVRGYRTTGATRALRRPTALEDAPVVARIRRAGGVIVGMANLHALAYGALSTSSDAGPVGNPLRGDALAGGSSGGSAAAVSAGLVDLALGTDTAGSIRIPAAHCGVVGLKPTYGQVPTRGVQALGPSLDHVGPLAGTVTDTAVALQVMSDRRLDAGEIARTRLSGVSVGVPTEYFSDHLEPEVRTSYEGALAAVTELGGSLREVSLPTVGLSPAVQLATLSAEAFDVHRELLRDRGELLPDDVRLRLEVGMFRMSADYVRAQRIRAAMRAEMRDALASVDVLVVPTLPIVAARRGVSHVDVEGERWTTQAAVTRLTMPFNLTGLPAVTVPWSAHPRGGTIGIQVAAAPHAEARLLGVAHALELEVGGI